MHVHDATRYDSIKILGVLRQDHLQGMLFSVCGAWFYGFDEDVRWERKSLCRRKNASHDASLR
jgi:hypothetical protein